MTTFEQIAPLLTSLNSITKSLSKKKSFIGTDEDGVDFRSQIQSQIEEGKSKINVVKDFLNKPHDRNDRAKITKIQGQFKQVSSEFEKEASEIIGLQLANAIGTGGRSQSLSLNGRERGSFSERIRYKGGESSFAQQEYSFGAGAQQQTIDMRHLEVTLDNPHQVEELIIQEYNTEVQSLVKDLQAIQDITNDLHMLTVEQGEQLKQAVGNTEVAAMDVEAGTQQLGEAYVYKKKYRKKVIIAIILFLVLVAIVVGIAVGVTRKK